MQTELNEYAIELEDSKQPSYRPIYILSSIELETLKIYIIISLQTGVIKMSKSFAGTSILFDKKLDGSRWMCIHHWGLNNLTIKKQYPLSLISGSLDELSRVKKFTQLDLTSTYHQIGIRKRNK